MITQILINSFVLGSTYALASAGMTLVYGIVHILNFAHGAIYMLGAYGIYFFAGKIGLSFFASLGLSVVCVTLIALLLDILVFRHIYGQFMQSLVATLGLSLVLESSIQFIFGADARIIRSFTSGVVNVMDASISIERIVIALVSVSAITGLYLFVKYTKIGKAMRAVEQDRVTASLYGISVKFTCLVALMLGFALAATAGGLMSPTGYISPFMGSEVVLMAFCIIIVGGLGSVAGCILAAYLVGTAQSIVSTLIGAEVSHLVTFAILGLVLLIKPSGFFGHAIED